MEPVTEWIRHRFPTVENVCSDAVEQLVKENRERVLLVDVRSPAEYEISHLQGAVRIDPEATNMDDVVKDLGVAGSGADTAVVCYCTVGFHASQLAQKLRNFVAGDSSQNFHGLIKIYNLEGGVLKWAREEKALVDSSNQPTSLVHPYSHLWAELLKADFKAPV
ncbi:tRNA uridine(34) hydroxylase-like [Heterodontus francisci]|uniref:tRNA uridine(34) hydroxylase-like n=1 Tax=Heterodontus francisci TaxID=7792 RepID=UPI00355B85BF